ncbi:MAG TPA: copper chaperone PCu(A)C [Rhizomicrobium sp.]|jgi:copper(I)-binding protein|nr:copper chaperone PCu(A)C [Rhizomicrobium sp.]
MRFMNSNALHIAAAAALALVVTVAMAEASEVKVENAWIRALPSGLPAGGYFTLHNNEAKPLTLTGAKSNSCGMLMLHKSSDMGGMMHMEDVTAVDVPAHGTLKFAPGGYHLMCMQPSADIKPGKTVSVTLTFANGSSVTAPFAVRSASGQ